MAIKVTLSNPRQAGDIWGYLPGGVQLKNGDMIVSLNTGEDRARTEEETAFMYRLASEPSTEEDWLKYDQMCAEALGDVNCMGINWTRSNDGGKTFVRAGMPCGASAFIQMENGEVIALEAIARCENGRNAFYARSSKDNCRRWSASYSISVTAPDLGEDGFLIVWGNALHLKDQTYLIPVYGKLKGDEQKHMRSMIFRTTDNFKTLHYLSTAAAWTPDTPHPKGFSESNITRTPDGRILCIIRNQGFFPMYQAHSSDDGATWTPARQMPAFGVDPQVRTLENGIIVCAYGRPGVKLMCSENNGDTWQSFTDVLFHSKSIYNTHQLQGQIKNYGRTCGYTALFVTGENKVTLFYTAPADWEDQTGYNPWVMPDRAAFRLFTIDAIIEKE